MIALWLVVCLSEYAVRTNTLITSFPCISLAMQYIPSGPKLFPGIISSVVVRFDCQHIIITVVILSLSSSSSSAHIPFTMYHHSYHISSVTELDIHISLSLSPSLSSSLSLSHFGVLGRGNCVHSTPPRGPK